MSINCQNCPMKDRIRLLESVVLEGKTYTPGLEEYYDVVVPALLRGDVGPLIAHDKRGGLIPDYDPLPKEARRTYVYKPRKQVERPGKPTNASGNPEGANNRLGPKSLPRGPASRIHPLPDPVQALR